MESSSSFLSNSLLQLFKKIQQTDNKIIAFKISVFIISKLLKIRKTAQGGQTPLSAKKTFLGDTVGNLGFSKGPRSTLYLSSRCNPGSPVNMVRSRPNKPKLMAVLDVLNLSPASPQRSL